MSAITRMVGSICSRLTCRVVLTCGVVVLMACSPSRVRERWVLVAWCPARFLPLLGDGVGSGKPNWCNPLTTRRGVSGAELAKRTRRAGKCLEGAAGGGVRRLGVRA